MIKIITIVYGRSDLTQIQQRTMARHIRYPFKLVAILNDPVLAADSRMWSEWSRDGIEVRTFPGVYDPASNTNPSENHARAANWAFQEYYKTAPILGFIDMDIFLVGEFNPWAIFTDHDILALHQQRGAVVYPWPGCLFLNMATMRWPSLFKFDPGAYQGERCDTGGGISVWMGETKPRVKWMGHQEGAPIEGMETLDGQWVHYRGASNWNKKPAEELERKNQWLKTLW